MKLTRRQQMILSKFLDLYRQNEEALHYTTLAEHLGVSSITAYDMLRLLEEHGLVISEFIPPSQREGEGRARVVFRPTSAALELLGELAGSDWNGDEWEVVKSRILQALREGKGSDYQGLLDDLLARIPERRSPMLYAAEMVTAIILQLYQLKEDAAGSTLFENLHAFGLPGELGLNALAGLTVGLSYVERANRRVTGFLLSHTGRYQKMLGRLSSENRRRLADFADEVMKIVES